MLCFHANPVPSVVVCLRAIQAFAMDLVHDLVENDALAPPSAGALYTCALTRDALKNSVTVLRAGSFSTAAMERNLRTCSFGSMLRAAAVYHGFDNSFGLVLRSDPETFRACRTNP